MTGTDSNPTDLTTILVLDHDPVAAEATAQMLQNHGLQAATGDPRDSVAAINQARQAGHDISVAVLGGLHASPGTPVQSIVQQCPGVVPIILTAYGTIEEAVSTMQQGAIDYLVRPVPPEQLRAAVDRAITRSRLLTRPAASAGGDYGDMVGGDPRMHRVFETARAVADAPTTVLMAGESGTGKSMIARAIHEQSPRAEAPFVEISCGSIPETLLESELFGHVKGAFTGAHADKVGKFEAACGGTIFLDEINSAPPSMQMKLLRVLQERVVEPVGSNKPVPVDARIILATNEPLEELVARGEFRQDLYYRIKVIDITLPPLRERIEDVLSLADHFLHRIAAALSRRIIGIDESARAALCQYHWPGNVRELENVVERAVVLSRGSVITRADLPETLMESSLAGPTPLPSAAATGDAFPFPVAGLTLREALEGPERQIILETLDRNGWNRQRSADVLDINRTTLYKKMKRYGLDRRVA